MKTTRASIIAASACGLIAVTCGSTAWAAVTVYSDQAQACYKAAKFGDSRGTGIGDCTEAMFGLAKSDPDLAGTLVNRGVLYLMRGDYRLGQADFDQALTLNPRLGEAYVNRGAALIGLKRYAEGVADIDRGLPLGPDEPEKAYYNRALADEALDDMKAAYFDYLKASQLKPDWAAPKHELTRFTVSQK